MRGYFTLSEQKVKVKSLSRVGLFATPWTVAYQAPPSMGFSRQECWSGLPFPSPGDLPDPGIEPGSPTLQADTLPSKWTEVIFKLFFAIGTWLVLFVFSLFPAHILSSEEPLFTPGVLKFNNKVACCGSVFTHWTENCLNSFNLKTCILQFWENS